MLSRVSPHTHYLAIHTVMGPESGDVVVRDFDGNVLSSQPPDRITFDGI
jgi:hypothetical protein